MTYGLPSSVARRLSGIRPVIRPSAAAQYGQQLVSRQNLSSVFSDIYRRAVESGYGGTSSAAAPITIGGGASSISPYSDPRMGYGTSIGGGAASVGSSAPWWEDPNAISIGGGAAGVSTNPRSSLYGSPATGGGADPSSDRTAEDIIAREVERQLGDQINEANERSSMLSSAIAELQAEAYALEQKRQEALAAARDDIAAAYGDEIDKITRQIGAYQGDLDRWNKVADETMARSREAFGRAGAAADTITQQGIPLLNRSQTQTRADIMGGYEDELADLGEELMAIDLDAESKKALVGDVMELHDLALQETDAQGKSAKALLRAAEGVARTAAEAAGAQDATQIKALEEAWSKQLTDAITGLMGQRSDLEKAREEAIKAAQESINAEFDQFGRFEGQLDYAGQVTNKAMDAWFASAGMDELERQAIESEFMSIINSGIRSEGELRAYMATYFEENGVELFDAATEEGIFTMLTVFNDAMNKWSLEAETAFANQDVSGGKLENTGDRIRYRRAGEAPDNIANRNHPAYQQRAAFMSNMAGYIQEAFGVTSVGQWRDTSVSGGGQRSANSDHYSGGAVDFSGKPEDIDRLFRWLQTQPWVSFAQIYTSGGAAGTLHVSSLLNGETHHVNDGHDHGSVAGTYTAGGGGGTSVGGRTAV